MGNAGATWSAASGSTDVSFFAGFCQWRWRQRRAAGLGPREGNDYTWRKTANARRCQWKKKKLPRNARQGSM